MAENYEIATVSVNGMSSVRMKMLEDFLHKQEIHILLLQEVTQHDFGINKRVQRVYRCGKPKAGNGNAH